MPEPEIVPVAEADLEVEAVPEAAAEPAVDAEPETAARAVAPVLDAVAELVGPEHALDGARLVTAWANGFLSMELGGAFQLGPGVDEAWEWGLRRIIAALEDRG